MRQIVCSLSTLALVLCISSGCEYEFKDEGEGSSKVVLLADVPRVAPEQGQSPGAQRPVQPPDVRPTLVPGKDVSGDAVLPAKAKKLNITELLERGVVTVKTNVPGLGDAKNAFDEIETTLAKSEGTNPFVFTFEFQNPISLKAVKVLSTYSDYSWAVVAEGTPRLVVDTVIDGQWSTVAWNDGVKTNRVTVEVLRKLRDNYVHLNEIELYE